MKREIDLTPYIPAIMECAEKTSERDYLILCLIGEGAGFRRGEVVGNKDRREMWAVDQFERAKKLSDRPERQKILSALFDGYTKVEAPDGDYRLIRDGQYVLKMRKEDPLPGLQVEDLHDGAIWVKGKGATEREQPIPKALYERLVKFIGKRETGPIFDWSTSGVYKVVKKYAKMAGVKDWKLVHPHRFRAYYARYNYEKSNHDISMTQSLMRHKDPKMTLHYVGEPSMDAKRAFIEGR